MNDCTGKEITVGDRVLYFGANSGNDYFRPAIMLKINKSSIVVLTGKTA
jgi:hypothetical protein